MDALVIGIGNNYIVVPRPQGDGWQWDSLHKFFYGAVDGQCPQSDTFRCPLQVEERNAILCETAFRQYFFPCV
jgi:hypothetical protein